VPNCMAAIDVGTVYEAAAAALGQAAGTAAPGK
jgi:hypothetical protein